MAVEKLRPTYDLNAIKLAIGSVETVAMASSALRDAIALGFDRAGVVGTILSIERTMFYKSRRPSPTIAYGRTSITCPRAGSRST
jgi:Motility quorum-sensing regulator, toxin of MqsA